MTFQRLAAYLTKRGYVRGLHNLQPCFVRIGEPPEMEHVVPTVDLMDAVVCERWDTIAFMLNTTPIEMLALMEPA